MTLEMLTRLLDITFMDTSQSVDIDMLSGIKHRLALLSVAQQDPLKAEQLLLANIPFEKQIMPLMNFASWPIVRYAVSGELHTPESEDYFNKVSAAATTIRSAITDAEAAKGTPALHILEKILALNSALPERYKAMANIRY